MIVLGCIVLLLGWLLHISILVTVGVVLLIVGAVLFVLSSTRGTQRWY
jgi:hypothetical protein